MDYSVSTSTDGKSFTLIQANISLELANQIACQATHWKIETYFDGEWKPVFSSKEM